ncbi:MAG: hypothetical protein UV70_C0016G0004, partial [Parcubacteria group bacterium GW2011_GWA2_43_13]
ITSYAYDTKNRLITITDALSGIRRYSYDKVGNKLTHTDKRSNGTSFVYDKLNRLIQETNALGTVTTYTYDANGNRLTSTTAGKTESISYDALNRPLVITHLGAKTETYTYDADGNVATKKDGKDQITTFTNDALGRVTDKLVASGTHITYQYDNWGNIKTLVDEIGTTTSTYDNENRLLIETKTFTALVGKSYSITRTYKADGQLASITDAASRVVNYEYNTRGLLDKVMYSSATIAQYTYNGVGKPTSLVYGNGIKTDYEYDALERLSRQVIKNSASEELWKQEYSYDAESNRARLTLPEGRAVDYAYDTLGQLKTVNDSAVSGIADMSFSYDGWGNRTTLTTPFGSTAYAYTASRDELASYTQGKMSVAMSYDNNGSIISETYTRGGKEARTVAYTWDTQNRLAGLQYQVKNQPAFMPVLPNNTLAFKYDDSGNRSVKTVNGVSSYYINSGLSVLNELDNTGLVTKTIIDAVAEIGKDGKLQYISQDVLGSAVLVTSDAGAIVSKYEYDPFGGIIGMQGSDSTKYLFTGQEFDPESELYYMNTRYHNPMTGRFISRDALRKTNDYIYTKNNPFSYIDPTGMEEQSIFQDWLSIVNPAGRTTYILSTGKILMPGTNNHYFSMTSHPGFTGVDTSVLQLHVDQKFNQPREGWRLDYDWNAETKMTDWHHNYREKVPYLGFPGEPPAAYVYDHMPAGAGTRSVGRVARVVKAGGGVMTGVSAGMDMYSISTAEDKPREAMRVAGGWATAEVAAVAGAKGGCVFAGAIFIETGPGAGVACGVGAFIGGISSGIAGYHGGKYLVGSLYDYQTEQATNYPVLPPPGTRIYTQEELAEMNKYYIQP